MKNIAFLCEKLSYGGIERVISILSKSLVEDNNLTIITMINNENIIYNFDDT